MANIIKKIKIKKQDGTFTDYIPIGAEAENINVDGESVEVKLNKTPYYYNSIADMKADEKLKVGDMAVTLGYYEVNDGGGAEYKIVSGEYVDDAGNYHKIKNNLFAELIIKDNIYNVQQYGAKNDGQTDASEAINKCFASAKDGSFINSVGNYAIGKTIILPLAAHVTVSGGTFLSLNENAYFTLAANPGSIRSYYTGYYLTIDNISLNGNYIANGLHLTKAFRVTVKNCNFNRFLEFGIKIGDTESHDNIIDRCHFIGRDNNHAAVESTGLILAKPDNQVTNCIFSYSKWAVQMLAATNMISNCHFYCNDTADGGNLYVSGGLKLIEHCYFDGSGIYFVGASNIIVDSCIYLVSGRTRGSLFNFHSDSNISTNGIQITNAVVSDYRTDKTVPFNIFNIDYQLVSAKGNAAEFREISSSLTLNNPGQMFVWSDSAVAAFSLIDDIEIATINAQTHIISSHSTTGIENYYDKVKISGNMAETHYIGATDIYRWVLIPFYVSGKASLKFKDENGEISGRIYDSEYNNITSKGQFSTLTGGKFFYAAYRNQRIIINN